MAIQPDLHLSRFAHLTLIKSDALAAVAGALADSVAPKFEVTEFGVQKRRYIGCCGIGLRTGNISNPPAPFNGRGCAKVR